MIIEYIKSLFIGIVQGITEWLPISSTGHMILFNRFANIKMSGEEVWNLFLVLIQLGSILAVIVLYFNRLNPFSRKKSAAEKRSSWNIWGKVVVGSIPVAVVGLLLDDLIESTLSAPIDDLIESTLSAPIVIAVIAVALVVYGIVFVVLEKFRGNGRRVGTIDEMSYKTAFLVGAFQSLSVIPGTSRSGSTIIGGMILGLERSVAAEFSFFLAIPAMLGASGLRVLKFILKGYSVTSDDIIVMAIGTVVAFLVSLAAISFLTDFVKKHSFTVFGWYRIALGAIVILFIALRII